MWKLLLLIAGALGNENRTEVTKDNSEFPSINILAKSDSHNFSIPQPSLDLSPTSLSESAPMIMALPDLQPNLEETDFAKNFPMDFSIDTPELDLTPSFPVDVEQEVDAAVEKDGQEGKVYGNQEEPSDKTSKFKREASQFPDLFKLMSSDNFQIQFPKADLEPRFSKFSFGGESREERKTEKRQVDLNSFRPSPLLSVTFNDLGQFQGHVRRPVRQHRGRGGRGPVYPPFDPFNTTYIPLPGPSSPNYALQLQGGNPHMFEKARFVRFRRPIRQSRFLNKPSPVLPSMLQKVNAAKGQVAEPFKYDASFDFEKSPYFDSFFSKRPK